MNTTTRRSFLRNTGTLAATAAVAGLTGLPRAHAADELGFLSAVDLAGKLRSKEIGAEELLPSDMAGFGFDNNADVLAMTPALIREARST